MIDRELTDPEWARLARQTMDRLMPRPRADDEQRDGRELIPEPRGASS